jgi:dihydrofolate reductase/thymidylate synthase
MSLAQFSIIVAVDETNGIAKSGEIPWTSRSDLQFFRETTMGRKRNAIIMGRKTYESIPEERRPLEGRRNVIISRKWKQENFPNISIFPSLLDALAGLGSQTGSYDEIFVTGGESVYTEAIANYLYLCKRVYVTKFKADYECDQFFAFDAIKNFPQFQDPTRTRDFIRYFFAPNVKHAEYDYLHLMKRIKDDGEPCPDRTGVGTKSIFGTRLEFDISERLPILTTKRIYYNKIISELLLFISGKTDSKLLETKSNDIWKENTTRKFLDGRGLTEYREGDMGPMYGFQWRHWGAEYSGCEADYSGQGVDQLQTLIQAIRDDPHSRRHILSSWNVTTLDKGVLAPCHVLAQFHVSGDRRHLDCCVFQRSADTFLGLPFNIASYAMLTYMIAHLTTLKPRTLIFQIGDTHIYNSHVEAVVKQLGRTPRPFPKLTFREQFKIHEIDDFTEDSFIIEDYNPCPYIAAKMAV